MQGSSKTLRSYIRRFTKTLSEMARYEDGVALEALKQGLLHKSRYKMHLCTFPPATVQQTLTTTKGFCDYEDEELRVEKGRREKGTATNTSAPIARKVSKHEKRSGQTENTITGTRARRIGRIHVLARREIDQTDHFFLLTR